MQQKQNHQRYSGFVPRVKICGMRDIESVMLAVRYGADAVGFITEVPVNTKRKIDREKARELVETTPLFVSTVMVFMPDDLNGALELIEHVRPDAVQVHTSMSIDDLRSMKKSTSIKLINAVLIDHNTHVEDILDHIAELSNIADAVLLDTGSGGRGGGTGRAHDWTISRDVTALSPLPIILAGGLHPANVTEAIEIVRPYGVDTASGVETGGRIDEEKIRSFILNARGK